MGNKAMVFLSKPRIFANFQCAGLAGSVQGVAETGAWAQNPIRRSRLR
jgi:hypothetical protein